MRAMTYVSLPQHAGNGSRRCTSTLNLFQPTLKSHLPTPLAHCELNLRSRFKNIMRRIFVKTIHVTIIPDCFNTECPLSGSNTAQVVIWPSGAVVSAKSLKEMKMKAGERSRSVSCVYIYIHIYTYIYVCFS